MWSTYLVVSTVAAPIRIESSIYSDAYTWDPGERCMWCTYGRPISSQHLSNDIIHIIHNEAHIQWEGGIFAILSCWAYTRTSFSYIFFNNFLSCYNCFVWFQKKLCEHLNIYFIYVCSWIVECVCLNAKYTRILLLCYMSHVE